ncbi:MAG: undecaprenyldiphospho-muramoylpentapeptide beta-N-acetylglucosaminyltransferase [Zymomonas mobilis subsp. pomaceae]|uniref:UDP-N-acetylglucosamine--N-acetylmuramyl-(pentapeptide) pyrophosphoryl-undecaprenol N-acetylglucosamine transferase n=1 Tax=Zymomonas mobilis subsp. pomaceae (strain ATCC 29192 / DSM 22645 / JCM 10191 / CCUG 17912 / NBRC 13757 / NCIMB 11200 / NRRL B-4491 / Barker I) TaxID=579138 RepID=F8EVC8_ZYMMT|nr:undecaprenyldiphospho-muramoylpentapeptide beta-N-acetylglucosaminyltransferase [Zymomonas mobilis]AEI37335.1 UDP-N-acetylglucosamine--N-acetylmuramyl-(pentapeptide) pyrophosphoryl-undecaprenol N-acetylglucosamine transferase [Zymomonas mobilis subsp. pomaceae ATCC 29192]MDX5948703.1 undecaprenyldiphospho-muramoylpentapeptide beta-N-acetylglucosaminyltransferase [Zymomonas mobilis subsp. pomaceae]GEB88508.1 UDP-N-acetylglucosamine--N-acetylmuramyl-(pentapeptide) pyrophosphoryl-undecaprenol N-
MNGSRQYILAAGGTGGHMIPAHALAAELMRRGHHVALITDERGLRFPGLFEGVQLHQLPAGRLMGGPKGMIQALRNIWTGRERALALYENFNPSAVVGFGGYPALPAILAAFKAKIPTIIHEQNAVMGRTNRFLARKVNAIATAYQQVDRLKRRYRRKTEVVGNPVRDEVLFLRDLPYPPLSDDGIFRILVVGGSQGAGILSEVVPEGLGLLPLHLRRRLQVTQQCRPEDLEKTRAQYAKLGIPADLSTYMTDLPQRLGWSHLVISRAGASTVAELSVAGRPAILIPYPAAMDNHQYANARELVASGGARLIDQRYFNPFELAKQIQKMALEPTGLKNAAMRARQVGYPDAAEKLADLVERVGGDDPAAILSKNGASADMTSNENKQGAVA